MTQQLSLFNKLDYHIDLASNPPKEIREWFSNRLDCLNFRIHDKNSDWVCETFNVGRENYAIRKHKFNLLTPQPSAPRTLYFYNNARADGLFSRHISPKSMVEKFINRSDRLILRVVEYRVVFQNVVFWSTKSEKTEKFILFFRSIILFYFKAQKGHFSLFFGKFLEFFQNHLSRQRIQ